MTALKYGFALTLVALVAAHAQSTYTQNFNSIGSGLPSGWYATTGASATSVGNLASFTTTATSWADTAGAFKNVAAVDSLASTATATTQANSTDRAFGLRQSGTTGFDPGAAFNFEFSTSGATVSAISLDLQMLSVQPRSTTFTIQYGIGPNPTTFTTLGTYPDPGAFGSTTFNFTTADFGSALDNQSDIVFRVAALTPSTGTGARDTVALDNFSLTSSAPITPITVVPEPSSYALLGVGLLICAQRFRRRATK